MNSDFDNWKFWLYSLAKNGSGSNTQDWKSQSKLLLSDTATIDLPQTLRILVPVPFSRTVKVHILRQAGHSNGSQRRLATAISRTHHDWLQIGMYRNTIDSSTQHLIINPMAGSESLFSCLVTIFDLVIKSLYFQQKDTFFSKTSHYFHDLIPKLLNSAFVL